MVDDILTSTLKSFRMRLDLVQAPLMLRMLRAILEAKRDHENPITSSEICELLGRFESGSEISKATAKKTLKTLLDTGLLEMRASGSRRTGYFSNASTVENGLKRLAKRAKSEITQEISLIDSEKKTVLGIDCAILAQDLVEELTGHRHRISSRLIVGAENIKRAIGYNMRDMAQKGDTIRVGIAPASPFLDEQERLIDEIAHAIYNDAEVRCLVNVELGGALSDAAILKVKGKHAGTTESSEEQKPGVEMRLYNGSTSYHAATFGNQYMALVVSDKPVTVAWITREFNPDIIDTSISLFDALWQDARNMVGVGVKGASSRDGTAGELLRQEEPTSRTIAATRETEERQTGNVQITEALDLMGFDTNEQRFSVLRIALQKHHRQGIPIDFASIYEQLKTESGGKDIRRSQVYRSLMSLENDGYIQGDRGSHPFHYAATPETLIAAFGDAKAKTLKTLEMRCEEINSEIDGLSGLNLIRLAIDTIEIATGVPSTATAAFAEGHDQIRELTDNEIYSATRKGDTLRVSLGWTCSIPNITQARIETLMEPVKRGARTKVLLGKHWEEDDSTIAPLRKAYESLLQDNRDVAVRLRTTKDSTYQLVARNNEGILLIVSEEPPAATYIPRSVNERLVDDAIASFDAEFEKGVDLRSTTVGSTGE